MAVTALKTLLMSRDQSLRVKEPGSTCVPSGSGDRLLNFMLRYYSDLAHSGFRKLTPKKISQAAGLRKKMLISSCPYSLLLENRRKCSFAIQS